MMTSVISEFSISSLWSDVTNTTQGAKLQVIHSAWGKKHKIKRDAREKLPQANDEKNQNDDRFAQSKHSKMMAKNSTYFYRRVLNQEVYRIIL